MEDKMEKTINEMLSLINVVKGRIAELKGLRTQLAVRETYFGSANKTVEPNYDVKVVDTKIVGLQNFLLEADSKIKTSNALTKIEIDVNVKELLSPLT
jgi:hypothetical protein